MEQKRKANEGRRNMEEGKERRREGGTEIVKERWETGRKKRRKVAFWNIINLYNKLR